MDISAQAHKDSLFNIKSILVMLAITLGYLLLSYVVIGFKVDQLYLMGIVDILFFLSFTSRRFIKGFSVFIIYWVIFDYMKAFPNYRFSPVHISDLYNAEKKLFGISFRGVLMTPNEYLRNNETTFMNVITGFFYLTWIPVPLGFAGYLFYKNKQQFLYFSLTFLLVNLIGFVVYYSYPAAPPWYIQYFGFQFRSNTAGNVAGLGRFDQFFHTGIFKSLYAKSSNVFAAMPSLHSSYPVIVLYYGLKNKLGYINILFALIMFGIWFAAIYNSHHYILDVLCGILCAITGIYIFNLLEFKNKIFNSFLQKNIATIS